MYLGEGEDGFKDLIKPNMIQFVQIILDLRVPFPIDFTCGFGANLRTCVVCIVVGKSSFVVNHDV